MTWEELMTEMRMEGVEHIDEVGHAYVEGNGSFTVLRRGGSTEAKEEEERGEGSGA